MGGEGSATVKVAVVFAVLAMLSMSSARAEDERASAAVILPDAPNPAVAPANALLAAPAAMITLKKAPSNDHKFFDLKNSLALGTAAAGLTADALSTQKGLSYPGFYEMNPVARPFMNSRAGAAVYSAGSFGLLAGGMYLAHRTHHHKLERVLPFAVGSWEGLLGLRNYHVIAQHTR